MIGAGLLWFGWYGFNVGSIVFARRRRPRRTSAQFLTETGVTFLNTTIATCAAMLGWLLMERILHGKATSLGAASGIVAGLVAITPACGAVDLARRDRHRRGRRAALRLAVGLKYRFGMRRLARRRRRPPGRRPRRHPADRLLLDLGRYRRHRRPVLRRRLRPLGDQVLAALFAIAVDRRRSPRSSRLAIKYTIGWRIDEEAEVEGIDFDQHGESAYDLHTSTSGAGSGCRCRVGVPASAPVTEGANA